VGVNDSLGTADIRLDDLEPFQMAERTYKLNHKKHGEKGTVRVRLLFQPEIIAKQRKATSVVGNAGRAMTQVGGLPVNAGKGLVSGVGAGVGFATSGVRGVFKRDHAKQDSAGSQLGPSIDVTPADSTTPVPVAAAGQVSAPVGVAGTVGPSAFPTSGAPEGQSPAFLESGTLRVSVRSAADLGQDDDVKPYAVLKVGAREQKTKHQKSLNPQW